MKKLMVMLMVLAVYAAVAAAAGRNSKNSFLVLCYHDVPKSVNLDNFAVDRETFVQELEYLRTHGYHFISVKDVLRARAGEAPLPAKAVMLTFDDSYLSFYESVLPVLKIYGYPCVLAVISSWVDKAPPGLKLPLMNWQQLREAARSGLVEIATHSHNLHHFEISNPQKNTGFAAVTRTYDAVNGRYENEEQYTKRIGDDLRRAREILKKNTGVDARVVVWPYGEYNQITVEEARKAGFEMMMTLDDHYASAGNLDAVPRYIVTKNPSMDRFISALEDIDAEPPRQQRILQADLDLIYDPDIRQQEINLDRFLDRVVAMQVNTVYLQAFCDTEGNGDIASVYFPSRVLPMKADLFARVANRLNVHGIQVYAWMPMLSIVLPDQGKTDAMRVRELRRGSLRVTTSWYHRLSPFDPAVPGLLSTLYEDLAICTRLDGIIFQDDGYLNDFEDFNTDARAAYRAISGGDDVPYDALSPEQKQRWYRLKTAKLIELTEGLKKAVRRYRPMTRFARTLYAPALLQPESEEWLAQNYADSLRAYDSVVIMSYPMMEKVRKPLPWLKSLVRAARAYPHGLEKTVFKVQAYDWEKKRWVGAAIVNAWLRALVAEGARNIAYYPDNYLENEPEDGIIRPIMSTEDFPFKRKGNDKTISK